MELETMFVEQKWNILRELSSQPQSPLQLSALLNTSMANVSQQLRLLEAAHFVGKHKIKNRDKGKPRALFSLTGDQGYVIVTSKGFAQKQLVQLDATKRAVLQIMFVKNGTLHAPLQQLFWSLYPYLSEIDVMLAIERDVGVEFIVAAKRQLHKKFEGLVSGIKERGIKTEIVGTEELDKKLKGTTGSLVYVLYDPIDALKKYKEQS